MKKYGPVFGGSGMSGMAKTNQLSATDMIAMAGIL
jgi:hypothetical protein